MKQDSGTGSMLFLMMALVSCSPKAVATATQPRATSIVAASATGEMPLEETNCPSTMA